MNRKIFKMRYLLGAFRIAGYKLRFFNHFKINGMKQFLDQSVDIKIEKNSYLIIGNKTYFSRYSSIDVVDHGVLKIGCNNFFNTGVKIVCMSGIDIGNNNLFGPNVMLFDHIHNYGSNNLICKSGYDREKIEIGSNVWLAAGCVICKGVHIGDNVVIGANSVVTHDLESGFLYAGAPARKIKKIGKSDNDE